MFSLLSFFLSHSFLLLLPSTVKTHIGTSLGRSPMVTFILLVLSNRYFLLSYVTNCHSCSLLILCFFSSEKGNAFFLALCSAHGGVVFVEHVSFFQGILINGQFPGPQIDAVTNDNLIINVYNYLREPFLISWYILESYS